MPKPSTETPAAENPEAATATEATPSTAVDARDIEIAALRSALADRDAAAESLRATLSDREADVAALRTQLVDALVAPVRPELPPEFGRIADALESFLILDAPRAESMPAQYREHAARVREHVKTIIVGSANASPTT